MKSQTSALCEDYELDKILKSQGDAEILLNKLTKDDCDTSPYHAPRILPWTYGAKLVYTDLDGSNRIEHFCLPPLIGRFEEGIYLEIVRLTVGQ